MLAILLANPAANLIGVVAVVLATTWPLYKTKQNILWAQGALHVAFALHFFLLGAYTASVMNGLGFSQAIAAVPLGKRPAFKIIYLLTLPLIAIGAYLTWQGMPSIFAALALALFSIGRYLSNTLMMRFLMLLGILSWTVHDILVMSVPALAADALSLGTSLWMLRGEFRALKSPARTVL